MTEGNLTLGEKKKKKKLREPKKLGCFIERGSLASWFKGIAPESGWRDLNPTTANYLLEDIS